MQAPGIPSVDQLLVLLTVVEEGSFTAAARRLQRATSAISYAIDTLEMQLGLPLFDRGTTRKPKLTHVGQAIVSEAKAVAHSPARHPSAGLSPKRPRNARLRPALQICDGQSYDRGGQYRAPKEAAGRVRHRRGTAGKIEDMGLVVKFGDKKRYSEEEYEAIYEELVEAGLNDEARRNRGAHPGDEPAQRDRGGQGQRVQAVHSWRSRTPTLPPDRMSRA